MISINRFRFEPSKQVRILNLMIHLVMTGEYSSPWSISRPLLGLILLNEQEFVQLQQQIISNQVHFWTSQNVESNRKSILFNQNVYLNFCHHAQVAEAQNKLKGYFEELMADVGHADNKEEFSKRKDQFTRNLYHFAQVVKTSLK